MRKRNRLAEIAANVLTALTMVYFLWSFMLLTILLS
jgi:hypothetical protein